MAQLQSLLCALWGKGWQAGTRGMGWRARRCGVSPLRQHFLHVECSIDAHNWDERETRFRKKFDAGLKHARDLFSGMTLPTKLDQVIIHGFASAPDKHRTIGGGRLVTSGELTAEIINGLPQNLWKNAVSEQFSLLRTLQIAKMGGAQLRTPTIRLIPI